MTHSEEIYHKHKCEIFDIIYDVYKRAPVPKDFSILFGFDNPEAEQKYIKEYNEFLKKEEPEIKRKFIELGFKLKEKEN